MPDLIIRFVTQGGFVSEAIRAVTFSEFSHAEIGTETGTWIGAHDDGGVQERPANYYNATFERRYAIPVGDEQYAAAMAYARSKIGTPYSFSDIAGLLFHKEWGEESHGLICSWFAFNVLSAAGIQALNVLPQYGYLVTPDTLHLSPIFIGKCIYETSKPQ
jgi:uncharacterized protein YycO